MKILPTNRRLKGLTLIEGLLFLGIAAIVVVGAVVLYNNASNTTKLNQAKSQAQSIVGGVKSLYSSQASYASVTTDLVRQAGIAPSNTIQGTNLRNPWGGMINITGNTTRFDVEFTQVPREACTDMASAGMAGEGSIIGMLVNGTAIPDNPTPADALAACTNANNDVAFRAR
jgi:Tfp pilus assembly protein PilE